MRHQGGIFRRRGTANVGRTYNQVGSDNVRLLEFVFARNDAILIEIGPGYFQFYRNGAPILSSGTPVRITGTPYSSSEINELQFSQSADVIYIAHENHRQATLSRYSDTNWVFEFPDFDYGPYIDQATGDQNTSLSLSGVTDRAILTSTAADFAATTAGQLVEYSYAGQKVLGLVKSKFTNYVIEIEPLEDRSLVLSKEVYSPGLYTGWDATNSVPTYNTTITGSGVDVAFSAVGVVTQEHIGNYLRFCDKAGAYYWMLVEGVDDILRQGAYGIIATGDILTVTVPTGKVTRSERRIAARLTSSDPSFFNLSTDAGRLFRLVLGEYVVHARVRDSASYALNGDTTNGSAQVNMSYEDASDVIVGDTVTGPGIPGGTTVIGVYPNDIQSYVILSANATATATGVTCTFVASSGQNMGVILNRPLPRSVEGLSVTQNGTSNDWNRGAWFTGNYPSTVAFHEGRLCFAGSPLQPQTVWMSKVDDLYNFGTTDEKLRVLDDSAITFTIASDTVNMIQWMVSRQILIIGTVGSEWRVSSTSQGSPITPTTVSVQSQSTYGCEFAKPVSVGKSIVYLQRAGRKLREMSYDFQSDSQVSLDLTVFAEHIFKDHGGAAQICYQQLPESAIYVRCNDGQVACLTYEPDQKVYAWTRFIIGGGGSVQSIACVPEDTQYRLYMIVSRNINGYDVRTVEVLDPEFRPATSTSYTDMVFLDNHYRFGPGGSAEITGLDDFKGCTVSALVNNRLITGLTVDEDGNLTLPHVPTVRLVIGHDYTSLLKTFPLEAQGQLGTVQGKQKRIDHLSLRLLDTINFSHGPTEANMAESDFRVATDPVNSVPPMFSGDKRIALDAGFSTRGTYFIKQTKALPLSILSVMPEVNTY